MRIGIDVVTTQNQDAHLGKGSYTLEIVRRLININKEDEFFLFQYDAPSTLDKYIMPDDFSAPGSLTYKPIFPNVNIVHCGRFWERSRLHAVGYDGLWFNMQFLPKIRSYDLDVFFAPMPFRGIPHKYTKVVSVIHDILQVSLNSYSERGPIVNTLKKFEYWYDLANIAKSDVIITDTEYTKKDLELLANIPGNKVKVIPLGVKDIFEPVEISTVRVTDSYNISGPYIIYWGGVERHKNIERLIELYRKLIKKHPDIKHKLVLGGGGFNEKHPRGKKYIKLVKKMGLEERVLFPGFLDEEDIKYLVSAADAYVTLSLYEGFGLNAIEAMRCKTAVLASDRSCHREVLGDFAVLVDPDDEKEVIDKLYKILANKELREKIAEEGYNFVKKYSWDKAAEETMGLILDTAK